MPGITLDIQGSMPYLKNGGWFAFNDSLHKEEQLKHIPAVATLDHATTSIIAGYKCFKATAKLEDGREATLWYTNELPIAVNPGLASLPLHGAILYYEDDSSIYQAAYVRKITVTK